MPEQTQPPRISGPHPQPAMPTGAAVPEGLTEMLVQFTVSVLREKPENIVQYAADYFASKARETGGMGSKAGGGGNLSLSVSKEESDTLPDIMEFTKQPHRIGRRQSVSAECVGDPDTIEIASHDKTPEQQERLDKILGEACKEVFFLQNLKHEQYDALRNAFKEMKVEAGQSLITQGDMGDYFYIIETGVYDVLKKSEQTGEWSKVHTFDNHGIFGELALLYNDVRSATVTAVTEGTVWALDRSSFRGVLLSAGNREKKLYEQFLKSTSLLEGLPDEEIVRIADVLTTVEFQEGDQIIKEGEMPEYVYFIQIGEVSVACEDDASSKGKKEITVKTLGDTLGEAEVFMNTKASASWFAKTKCRLARLSHDAFERVLGPLEERITKNVEEYNQQRTEVNLKPVESPTATPSQQDE